jgi:hypothetical protein
VVVVLKMRVLCRKWEMSDYQKRIINWVVVQHATMGYAPFNWGSSFTAVPMPIKMPSCIVLILSCEPSLPWGIKGEHEGGREFLTSESSSYFLHR